MTDAGRVGCLIPAYEAADTVGGMVRLCLRHVERVLVVDDGSRDATAREARRAGAQVLRHGANRGKGAALASGFTRALALGWEAAVCLDADGQHDPIEIPAVVSAWRRGGWDVVVGNRLGDPSGMSFARLATNRVTSRIVSALARRPVADSQCGYRLVSARAMAGVRPGERRFAMEGEFLIRAARAGLRIGQVPVRSRYARGGSHIRPLADTLRFLRMAAAFV
ncbi:MAG: glycosyltransferase family 2 protein [Planctomycetes bacterium]|nr:glycosyltransferase family 2 protein [Planctomycetota bacterium]